MTTRFKTTGFETAEDVLAIDRLCIDLETAAGPRPVLDDVSLKIRQGETACLVGESGSGKSLTSLAIMGLLPPGVLKVRSGGIMLEGTDLLSRTPRQLRNLRGDRMAMIFQEPMTALNPVMRVGDQIAEVLDTHARLKGPDRRARVLEAMEQVHLPDIARIFRAYPHQLSGGQRQRVMIAMALILEPALLIADEPTTALDVTTQKQILSLIAEMQRVHGTAVLFITHDMGVVSEIADTVHVMRQGRLVETAPAERLFRAPEHDYTRALLAAVPSLRPRAPREPQSRPPVLDVAGLGKTYRSGGFLKPTLAKRAAEDVSFALRPGRTIGIVGESGSGKSTVARCVMRLIDPGQGRISLAGTDITHLKPGAMRRHRAKIQIVFQDPYRSLNPRRRIADSLIEGPMNFGRTRDQALARARDLLETVGLTADALDRYPHQFSGGQRQRIAIARAVAMEPEVIVADEAVSALDVSVQDQVLKLLERLQDELGIAILFITHDLRVAAQICDEVIVMQQGRVVEQGPAGRVLVAPRHAYTHALIDAAPGRGWDFAACREIAPLRPGA
ncbi:ABC transporter ATP-binding protein [Tistrella mobilis]|uniref:ABC transporter, ATP-binding protein n=1 Tax=Tistrella mobilis (strain KA081020-065) TaxID=1110502 RepID=I3TRN8_TISMK|nr:ABC transporter ATP-binding protein [Tistrella mobilis]AFK55426.1 putative ABC transporter, ATP-binding protein [Tistrella mobilis KA081020-065]